MTTNNHGKPLSYFWYVIPVGLCSAVIFWHIANKQPDALDKPSGPPTIAFSLPSKHQTPHGSHQSISPKSSSNNPTSIPKSNAAASLTPTLPPNPAFAALGTDPISLTLFDEKGRVRLPATPEQILANLHNPVIRQSQWITPYFRAHVDQSLIVDGYTLMGLQKIVRLTQQATSPEQAALIRHLITQGLQMALPPTASAHANRLIEKFIQYNQLSAMQPLPQLANQHFQSSALTTHFATLERLQQQVFGADANALFAWEHAMLTQSIHNQLSAHHAFITELTRKQNKLHR